MMETQTIEGVLISRKQNFKLIVAETIMLVVLLSVTIPNICLFYIGKETQIGKSVGSDWQVTDDYSKQAKTTLDMGNDQYNILLLTDVHFMDRGTFAKELGVNYILDEMAKSSINKLIKKQQPNLILVLGDSVRSDFNDVGMREFVEFIDSHNTPWALVFGNHDDEGRADKNKLVDILKTSKYGLFQYGPKDLHGAGNYVLNLERNDKTEYVLFMMDTGSGSEFSQNLAGINEKQIAWYEWNMDAFRSIMGEYPKNMAFFHIPFSDYINMTGDYIFGERHENPCTQNTKNNILESMLLHNGTHIMVGHDHVNNFFKEYKGMKIGYAMKSSYSCYYRRGMIGGTMFTINKDNSVTERLVHFN